MIATSNQRHWHVAVAHWLLSCACMTFLAMAFASGKWAYDLALDFMSAASLTNYPMRDTAFLWDHLAGRFEQEWGQKRALAQFAQDWQWLKYFMLLFLPLSILAVRYIHLRSASTADPHRSRSRTMLAVGLKVSVAICLLFCVAVAGGVSAMVSSEALLASIFLVRPVELAVGFALILLLAPKKLLLGWNMREKTHSPRPLTIKELYAFWRKFIAPIFANPAQWLSNLVRPNGPMRMIAPAFLFYLTIWMTLFTLLDIGRLFDYWASGVALGFIEPGTIRTSPQAPWDHMSLFLQELFLPYIKLSFVVAIILALYDTICKFKIQQSSGAYAVRGIKLSVRWQWIRNIFVAYFIILIFFQIYNALLAFAFKFSFPYIAIPLFVAMLFLGWHLLNRLCPSIDRPQQGLAACQAQRSVSSHFNPAP